MKAYQVFKGGTDKHNRQCWDLAATYLNKAKALEHTTQIISEVKLDEGETLEESEWKLNGTYKIWWVVDGSPMGWSSVGCCKINEIEITE
jgi:hypothetical protein